MEGTYFRLTRAIVMQTMELEKVGVSWYFLSLGFVASM